MKKTAVGAPLADATEETATAQGVVDGPAEA